METREKNDLDLKGFDLKASFCISSSNLFGVYLNNDEHRQSGSFSMISCEKSTLIRLKQLCVYDLYFTSSCNVL